MIWILPYAYKPTSTYSLMEKQVIVSPTPLKHDRDWFLVEWMSWYEVGQLMGGN